MSYILLPKPEGSAIPADAIEVDVCLEDGTVHQSRFFCPTCYMRRSED